MNREGTVMLWMTKYQILVIISTKDWTYVGHNAIVHGIFLGFAPILVFWWLEDKRWNLSLSWMDGDQFGPF